MTFRPKLAILSGLLALLETRCITSFETAAIGIRGGAISDSVFQSGGTDGRVSLGTLTSEGLVISTSTLPADPAPILAISRPYAPAPEKIPLVVTVNGDARLDIWDVPEGQWRLRWRFELPPGFVDGEIGFIFDLVGDGVAVFSSAWAELIVVQNGSLERVPLRELLRGSGSRGRANFWSRARTSSCLGADSTRAIRSSRMAFSAIKAQSPASCR